MARPSGSTAPRDAAVQQTMLRALAVLRVVLLLNSVALYALHAHAYRHPVAGWLAMVLLVAWTGFVTWAYDRLQLRRTPVFLGDLGVAVGALLLTTYVKDPGFSATLPGFWVAAAVLAWAVHWRLAGGLVAAVVVVGCDLGIRAEFGQGNYGNVFLLLIGGSVVGFLTGLLEQMAVERDLAQRHAAVEAERARLARAVHDGVLQTLALVQRRSGELGGSGGPQDRAMLAELGQLAGEQEVALRSMIRQQDTAAPGGFGARPGSVDLSAELERVAGTRATVVVPPGAVLMDVHRADELAAVVGACLDNVVLHAGPGASAWVLLEVLGETVVVSVRDDGQGIAPGRLEAAEHEGRLGVSQSIRGRVADLDGSAVLDTGEHGTEWELTVALRST